MLSAALEYPLGDWNGFCVYRPARGGRLCEHFDYNPNTFTFINIEGGLSLTYYSTAAQPCSTIMCFRNGLDEENMDW